MDEEGRVEVVPAARDAAGTALGGLRPAAARRVIWIGYAVVLAGMFAARALPLDPHASLLFEQVIWSIVGAIAAVVLAVAWYWTSGIEARVWGVIASAAFLMLAGQAYYGFVAAAGSAPDLTSVAPTAAFDVLAGILFLTLLAWLTRMGHASFAARARFGVDALAVSAVAVGVLGLFVIGPWFESMGATPVSTRLLYASSPVVGAIGLVGTGLVVVGVRFERWESWERLLAASVATLGLGLVLAPVGFADSRWGIGGGWVHEIVDMLWVSGIYIVAAAAVYRHLDYPKPWRVRPLAVLEPGYGWLPTVVLPAIEVAAVPIFAAVALRDAPGSRVDEFVLSGSVAVALALRTLLSVADASTLEAGASRDPLTGLGSVRRFHEQLSGAIVAATRYQQGLSVIVVDLDDFEHVNAAGGFAVGDTALVEFARAVERAVRPQDAVSRIGGDKVAVIMPASGPETAQAVAEDILAEVRRLGEPAGSPLSASAGIASFPHHGAHSEDLLERAEAARVWSKSHGKDRITVFDPDVVGPFAPISRIRETTERSDVEAVRALAAAVDERDPSARDHSTAVSRTSVEVARDLGLGDDEVLAIEYAALLHDIGKIGMPDSALRAGGVLSQADQRRLREHPVLGEQLLTTTHMRRIPAIVRHHHERWDGAGYPDGLAGDQIPLGARIIALANEYDVLRRGRSHGVPLSRTAALQEIDLGLGTVFDPELGERFIGIIGRRNL